MIMMTTTLTWWQWWWRWQNIQSSIADYSKTLWSQERDQHRTYEWVTSDSILPTIESNPAGKHSGIPTERQQRSSSQLSSSSRLADWSTCQDCCLSNLSTAARSCQGNGCLIKAFRFWNWDDCVNEICLVLSSARAWVRVILVGKTR